MLQLLANIAKEADNVYERSAMDSGLIHNSQHESYAVMLEKVEEAQIELTLCQKELTNFWTMVLQGDENELKTECLERLRISAVSAAYESIQLAAMAHKAKLTVNRSE